MSLVLVLFLFEAYRIQVFQLRAYRFDRVPSEFRDFGRGPSILVYVNSGSSERKKRSRTWEKAKRETIIEFSFPRPITHEDNLVAGISLCEFRERGDVKGRRTEASRAYLLHLARRQTGDEKLNSFFGRGPIKCKCLEIGVEGRKNM